MKKLVLTLAMSLAFSSSHANAQNPYPDHVIEDILSVGNIFTEGVTWPPAEENIGFKSLRIGEEFDPNAKFVHAYVKPRDADHSARKPFNCKFSESGMLPVLYCKVTMAATSGAYGKDVASLGQAFGSRVKVTFDVVLDSPPTLKDLRERTFSKGKIQLIKIVNLKPDDSFDEKAKAHFTGLFKTEPDSDVEYHSPGKVYSDACAQAVKSIQKKPADKLTLEDKATLKRCNGEAKAAIFAGKAVSGSNTVHRWDQGVMRVRLFFDTTRAFGAVTRESTLVMATDSVEANAAWKEKALDVIAQWKAKKGQQDASDF